MKRRCLTGLTAISLATFFSLTLAWMSDAAGPQPDNRQAKIEPRFIAYYFYTSRRCGPCTQIEEWSQEAVTQTFQDQIKAGQLQWQAINVDLPENQHFIQDFQLYSKSVIVAEYKKGKAVRWTNLKDIWKLYRDREKYFDYIARETRAFMGENT
ncbi:MAG: nitrophenyl compound nitroreductase subunit ArsF family protein [Thermodesulfobacteriota bacterium]